MIFAVLHASLMPFFGVFVVIDIVVIDVFVAFTSCSVPPNQL